MEEEAISQLRFLHSPDLRKHYPRNEIQEEIRRLTEILNEILQRKHKWVEDSSGRRST